jgi:hypothetical protein
MTKHDERHTADEDVRPEPAKSAREVKRRRRAIAGVASLAAVLGPGAYLTTTWLNDQSEAGSQTDVTRIVSLSPMVSAASAPPVDSEEADSGRTGSASAALGAEAAEHRTPAERVDAAREAAAKDGVQQMHPRSSGQDEIRAWVAENAMVKTAGSVKKDRSTLRVVSARGDLTGQREHGWVAGGVTKHGDISCSQTFKLSNESKPEKRDTLLVCWRISPKRSVLTALVDLDGNPSVDKSRNTIQREWRKLS